MTWNSSGSFVIWLLSLLILGAIIFGLMAWRTRLKMKAAVYHFRRREAEIRWQLSVTASAIFIMLSTMLALYGFVGDGPAAAAFENDVAEVADALTPTTGAANRVVTRTPRPTSQPTNTPSPRQTPTPRPTPVLDIPAGYNRFEPTANLRDSTTLSDLQFSEQVDNNFRPINAAIAFPADTDTLYATFDYQNMVDGMAWTFLWRLDGEVIEGGNELWEYGQNGPGYMFVSPEEGLSEGTYSAEIWINSQLFQRAYVTIGQPTTSVDNLPSVNAAVSGESLIPNDPQLDQFGSLNEADELAVLPSYYGAAISEDSLVPNEALQDVVIATRPAFTVSEPVLEQPPFRSASIPQQYNTLAIDTELSETTEIEIMRLDVDLVERSCDTESQDDCVPVEIFGLSAAFYHQGLADGMTWTWLWRHNAEIIDGANLPWDGPAHALRYLHFSPPDGFATGEYVLEIWVNAQLQARGNVDINAVEGLNSAENE